MKFYDEVRNFRNSAKAKLNFIDREIGRVEQLLTSQIEKDLNLKLELQRIKQHREELNSLYFLVNVHNPTFQESFEKSLEKSNLLLGEIFGLKPNEP
ncbi:hypothetical protein MM239_19085 [Belliella sp. DSM 111904]|uniref:Uncharacterized protein n=1 Tax=Belliella filtrata TaxID=2923435 RepID=A0ABS9V510_9BACT|nr:hypothetical protein [Belliella filtrata]MCH7411501.1 hypothetical protein [Belliella filtrata]